MIIDNIFNYITNNWIEVLGMTLGIFYVIFSVKVKPILWIFGLLSCICYLIVFFKTQFYALGLLQVYYIIMSIYGLWLWLRKNNENDSTLSISNISKKQLELSVSITLATAILLFFIFKNDNTPVIITLGDAFTTSFCVAGTWLLAHKIIHNWLFFIISDVLCVIIFTYKEMYPTVILFATYVALAFIGYYNWKKELKSNI